MFIRIPWNLFEDYGDVIILRFWEMLKKTPGNVRKDSGECLRRFPEMFEKVPKNLTLDLYCEILLIFIKFCN